MSTRLSFFSVNRKTKPLNSRALDKKRGNLQVGWEVGDVRAEGGGGLAGKVAAEDRLRFHARFSFGRKWERGL